LKNGLDEELKNEIKVHWALASCEGVLQLREVYEDSFFIYLVLDF